MEFLMRISTILPLLVACSTANLGAARTANLINEMDGSGYQILVETADEMERRSNEDFLHPRDPDMTITIKYGDLPDHILGQARVGWSRCDITMSRDMEPERGQYDANDLRLVLMHEIGHCFGLMHAPSEEDVMFWAYSRPSDEEKSVSEFIQSLNDKRGVR
jgi:hypothetical protein